MLKPSVLKLFVLLSAQAVWVAAVLYGALAALPFFGLQLWAFSRTPELHFSAQKYVVIVSMGLLVDLSLAFSGLVSLRNDSFVAFPVWLALLWMSFVLTIFTLLKLLKKTWLSVLVFSVGGVLAYLGGAKLGAATIINPPVYLVTLIILWALYPLFWRKVANL